MKTVTATYARNNFQEVINIALFREEPILVTRRRRPVVISHPYREKLESRRRGLLLKPAIKLKKILTKKEAILMFAEMTETIEDHLFQRKTLV